jgi:hypothetical protein
MGKTIDTPYAVNDTVKVGTFARGQRLLAWLPAGATVAVGDPLESAGNGLLRPVTTGVALVRALQAVANPASAVRVRVEVL